MDLMSVFIAPIWKHTQSGNIVTAIHHRQVCMNIASPRHFRCQNTHRQHYIFYRPARQVPVKTESATAVRITNCSWLREPLSCLETVSLIFIPRPTDKTDHIFRSSSTPVKNKSQRPLQFAASNNNLSRHICKKTSLGESIACIT